MKIGLHIVNFDWPGGPGKIGSTLADIARTADEAGFYSLWVVDHFFQLGERYGSVHGPAHTNMLEGYGTMSYMAGLTRRIKLGLLVTCNLYREPGALVKTVTTLDVLSGGRAYLGIGAGWYEREARGLGLPIPPTWTERFERLEETMLITRQMWAGDTAPFHGKYYRLEEPICQPLPVTQPHPPILIGGEGEKKTLRLVAKYADACNFVFGAPVAEFGALNASYEKELLFLQRKLDVLRAHCEKVGRAFDEIEKTAATYILLRPDCQSPAEIVDVCGRAAELGFQHIMFIMPNVYEIEPLNVVGAEIIPQVRDL